MGVLGRREFLHGLTVAGTATLLGGYREPAGAEPPPETTTLKLARTISICQAPQYVAGALLAAEGFTDVQFVGEPAYVDRTLVSGEAQMGMVFLGPLLLRLDEGAPLLILSGGHVGCLELFAHEPIRTVRDLKGRSVAVTALAPIPTSSWPRSWPMSGSIPAKTLLLWRTSLAKRRDSSRNRKWMRISPRRPSGRSSARRKSATSW